MSSARRTDGSIRDSAAALSRVSSTAKSVFEKNRDSLARTERVGVPVETRRRKQRRAAGANRRRRRDATQLLFSRAIGCWQRRKREHLHKGFVGLRRGLAFSKWLLASLRELSAAAGATRYTSMTFFGVGVGLGASAVGRRPLNDRSSSGAHGAAEACGARTATETTRSVSSSAP